MPTTHDIKCQPDQFAALLNGSKRFEFRRNDRNYKVGDLLTVREYRIGSNTYTDRAATFEVLYITRCFDWLPNPNEWADWVVMSLSEPLPNA